MARISSIRKDRTQFKLFLLLGVAAGMLLIAIFAGQICPYDPDLQNLNQALQAPSAAHWAGTDRFGRDLFSRILLGLQTSIFSTLLLVGVTCLVGSVLGICCGYFGGSIDTIVMRIGDICLAFPGLVFALAIAALLNGGLMNAVLALAVISWPKYARVARSQTLALKDSPFIWAAKQAGTTAPQMIWRHILPNCLGPILVTAMLDIGTMLMELAGLSFLGLGAQPPTAELGSMMSENRSLLQLYPWVVLGPGAAIFLTVAVFNLLGDAARDFLDPRSKKSNREILE